MLCASFDNGNRPVTTFYCKDIHSLQDAIFSVKTSGGNITYIGEKKRLGGTPNGLYSLYEYQEIKEEYP